MRDSFGLLNELQFKLKPHLIIEHLNKLVVTLELFHGKFLPPTVANINSNQTNIGYTVAQFYKHQNNFFHISKNQLSIETTLNILNSVYTITLSLFLVFYVRKAQSCIKLT